MSTNQPKQEERDSSAEDRQRLAQVRTLMEIAAGQALWSVTAFTGSLAAARDLKALLKHHEIRAKIQRAKGSERPDEHDVVVFVE
ncbi:MAG: hypothetical protein ABI024_03815 [Vicinamibacterales bacterium]